MSSERMYSLGEVNEILDIRQKAITFGVDYGHGAYNLERAQALLITMKKYPKVFETQIRTLEKTMEEEKKLKLQ